MIISREEGQMSEEIERTEGFTSSPEQRHLWALQRADGVQPYHVQATLLFEGNLQAERLNTALASLVEQYEILRTRVICLPGTRLPVQVIAESSDGKRGLEAREAAELSPEDFFTRRRQAVLDPERGLLPAFVLHRLDAQKYLLSLDFPSCNADATTPLILFRALQQAYVSQSEELATEETIQYADLAAWRDELLENEEARRAYWPGEHARYLFHQTHPFETKEKETSSFAVNRCAQLIDQRLTEQLVTLANRQSISLRALLFAAWSFLLWRDYHDPEICVSISCDYRTAYTDLAEVPGLLTSYVPVCQLINEQTPFLQFAHEIEQAIKEAERGQDFFSWEEGTGLTPSHATPQFPALSFDFSIIPEPAVLDDLRISFHLHYACLERSKLRLSCQLAGESLQCHLYYDENIFARSAVERIIEHFAVALRQIVAQPHCSLKALPVLSEKEHHTIIVSFNEIKASSAPHLEELLHQRIEQQAARTPDAIALAGDNQSITYQTMNERANQLAHLLRRSGVRSESPVGLLLDNSPAALIGILAILKAGGTYIPLPPTIPTERLQWIMQETGLLYVLTERSLSQKLPGTIPQVIYLDEDDALRQQEPRTNPTYVSTPQHLAYIIYTSGSTGTPKGVMITHLGLTNYVQWSLQAYQVAEGWGTPAHSSLGFDLTITSLFPPLLVGKRVVFVPEQAGIEALKRALLLEGPCSLLKITPAHLALLSQQVTPEEARRLARVLVIGGEALYDDELQFWRTCAPDTLLYNEYGPTETVVGCCLYDASANRHHTRYNIVPIGHPIAHTRCYILDTSLSPVPIGVPGELYISGAGVGRGYAGRPDLTAEVFLPDPFSPLAGTRMYKTGDIALYREDGTIEYQKRNDRQIKLRGFRIELGEIETVMRKYPGVREAVVLVSQHPSYERRLLAYVTSEGLATLDIEKLQNSMQHSLPDYMLPAHILQVPAFPLTRNGKIDRDALLALEQRSLRTHSSLTPRDLVELELVHIWEDILHTQPIGVSDHFFDLGGNSFLAMSLLFQLEQRFGSQISLHAFFEHPTIEYVAGLLRQPAAAKKPVSLVPLKAQGTRKALFLVHPVGGTVLCYLDLARLLDPEQQVYGLQSAGLMGECPPLHTIEEIATHYIAEIRAFQPEGPYWLAGWSMGGVIAIEMARQLQNAGHEVASLVLLDSLAPDFIRQRKRDDRTLLTGFASHLLGGFLGQDGSELIQQLLQYPAQQQLAFVLEQVKAANILPPDTSLEHLHRIFEVFRANAQAEYSYEIQAYQGKITVICAEAEMERHAQGQTLGWERVADAEVETFILPGNHYTLLKHSSVQRLAEHLNRIGRQLVDNL